jgi:protein-tyrosine phosphatase
MSPSIPEVWTSETHPLRIAELDAPGGGRIGVTFCPGKHQPEAFTGCWRRDLNSDLDVIEKWGADAVVTLVETHELDSLNVPALGSEVQARGIAWLHLPIVDNWIPDATFEQSWAAEAPTLHATLDRGGRVLVHCKGGLGRAGTIAARLLIERGAAADEAIAAVRRVRVGAIENRTQEDYLRGLRRGAHDG